MRTSFAFTPSEKMDSDRISKIIVRVQLVVREYTPSVYVLLSFFFQYNNRAQFVYKMGKIPGESAIILRTNLYIFILFRNMLINKLKSTSKTAIRTQPRLDNEYARKLGSSKKTTNLRLVKCLDCIMSFRTPFQTKIILQHTQLVHSLLLKLRVIRDNKITEYVWGGCKPRTPPRRDCTPGNP